MLENINDVKCVAVIGGTGPQGRGLARRFALSGLQVAIGSRRAARAADVAAEIAAETRGDVWGAANIDVAQQADPVLIAVPWEGHRDVIVELEPHLKDKIVIDCVNPLGFDKQGAFALTVTEGSAAEQAASVLPKSRVVAAFHHVSAVLLEDATVDRVETDVLVLGDDRTATTLVEQLAGCIPGMRGIYGGRLRNAHQVEALTANLISINRRYSTHAGLYVTGV